jgi:hypothetical protein
LNVYHSTFMGETLLNVYHLTFRGETLLW